MERKQSTLEDIVSLAKRRGFIFQGSELYGGLAGTFDYGPLGVALKNNIKNLWWKMFVTEREDMHGLDSAIIMPEKVWEASGHLAGFADPMVECAKCHHRFRADHLNGAEKCPDCGGSLGEARMFNLLFPVAMGSTSGNGATSYLRGELAQGMFVNFKNVIDSLHPKLPFGLAQVGKVFRNEIAPRDFLFRSREFELMEFEYFVRESEWEKHFESWKELMWKWIDTVGIDRNRVHELEVSPEDRAHYSSRTVDFEFDFPFGRKELYGLAYRGNYDLSKHAEASGENLEYQDSVTNEHFIPHVIEPTFGLDRTVLAVLASSYDEDELGGEKRAVLRLSKELAPTKVAVFPLLKNKPELVERAREVWSELKKTIPNVAFDDNGNIGKRYRRQDEIGTPYCVTIDFDTLENHTVTVRDRDTGEQERVAISDLPSRLA